MVLLLPTLTVVACGCLSPYQAGSASLDTRPAAIVSSISGEARVRRSPEEGFESSSLFDSLYPGALLEVPQGSRVNVLFASGKRYELVGRANGKVTSTDFERIEGKVLPLPQLPRFPLFDRSAALKGPGRPVSSFSELYPSGVSTRAGSTTFHFASRESIETIVLRVFRETELVHELSSEASSVTLPEGILVDGTDYSWQPFNESGRPLAPRMYFSTLDSEALSERTSFRRELRSPVTPMNVALQAEIDRRLGLYLEARNLLLEAQRDFPGDETISTTLARIEADLPMGIPGVLH